MKINTLIYFKEQLWLVETSCNYTIDTPSLNEFIHCLVQMCFKWFPV